MKRIPGPLAYFENDANFLAVTGVGKARCAAVTGAALSQFDSHSIGAVVNIGIAGSTDRRHRVGDLLLINKITEAATGRSYFPDMLCATQIPEECLTTVDTVVNEHVTAIPENGLMDMEAAGFYEAASLFVGPHKIICLKMISDHLSNLSKISPVQMRQALLQNMPQVAEYVTAVLQCNAQTNAIELQPDHMAYLNQLKSKLRITQTQYAVLSDAVRRFINAHPQQPLPDVHLTISTKLQKKQRNQIVDELTQQLLC
ncbi:MAG: hypothetical protein JXR45_01055 [Deltaproteobacteria bacterium]|nr:hypothetical protein [Deltaproteobacteria bacterium]